MKLIKIHRHRRVCSYGVTNRSIESVTSTSSDASSSQARVSQETDDTFPAVYFVDSSLFQRSLNQLPDLSCKLDTDLRFFIGNVFTDKTFVHRYFTIVHPWISFLSRKGFIERVLNPLGQAQPGNTLLIAAMKLVAVSPQGDSRSAAYRSIKKAILWAEMSGLLNFRIFQTLILIALYELGHAIFPSAYLTIGYCVQYGSALGIDKAIENTADKVPTTTESEEEKRRSWWALILLDR